MLAQYQKENLERLQMRSFSESKYSNVTALQYYFYEEAKLDAGFYRVEYSFLSAFDKLGVLNSVLIVNKATDLIRKFCDKYSVSLQIEEKLRVGSSKSLCIDIISNMHKRFSTEYLLMIQPDGIVAESNLGDFLGKYDYIGAPWGGRSVWYDFYSPRKYSVGNGGFSLRSHEICSAASARYGKFWRHLPYFWTIMGDDVFFCKTLPFFDRSYAAKYKIAPPEEAAKFSVEHMTEYHRNLKRVFGFHAEVGFENYLKISSRQNFKND